MTAPATTKATTPAVLNPAKGIWPAIVRTIVPRLAAVLITFALRLGIEIDSVLAFAIVEELIAWVYYIAVRILEVVKSSKWGVLLGKTSAPLYKEAIEVPGREVVTTGILLPAPVEGVLATEAVKLGVTPASLVQTLLAGHLAKTGQPPAG